MKHEIESLNLADLDIEALEQRIELGQLIPPMENGTDDCVIQSGCGTNCGTYKPPN